MPSLGLGVSIPKQWALITRPVDTEFITFTSPKDKYVYFSKCIEGHIGVSYDIDLLAQRNMVYFGKCITGTREIPGYKPFITEWAVSGTGTALRITLPLYNQGIFNLKVDWGDGTPTQKITSYNQVEREHTYANSGNYDVSISGLCPSWSFESVATDKNKITKVKQWGDVEFSYLYGGFYQCTNLNSLGSDGIKGSITNFTYTFSGCKSLTTLPTDLFRYNTNATNFTYTFSNCTNLTTLPTDLFRYNTNVTEFYGTFQNCTNLTTLPTDLFRYNTNVTRFEEVLRDCTNLTTLPTDLFRYNTNVTNFISSFLGCTNLTTLPTDLFRYNTNVTTFYQILAICPKLTLNSNIFSDITEYGTRFLNKSVNFSRCFDRDSFNGTQGVAPELWSYNFGTGTPTKTDCFNGAGNSLTSLSNYSSIPAEWV